MARNQERASHLIHPYPAKLLAHIPFYFLSQGVLSEPGDLVGDLFCGSGTVLLESVLAGRQAFGADSNPLARLIASVKTTRYDQAELTRKAAALRDRIVNCETGADPDVVNLELWFYPHVVRQLKAIHAAIRLGRSGPVRAFFEVCFSACIRRVSLADPRLSVPVRQRADHYHQRHPLHKQTKARLQRLRHVDVVTEFQFIVKENIRRAAAASDSWRLMKVDAKPATLVTGCALVERARLPLESV